MKTALLGFVAFLLVLPAFGADQGWFGFAVYPGARQLCDQNVIGSASASARMEIHWLSFATADAPEKVISFYQKAKVKSEKDADATTFRLDKDTTLAVYTATSTAHPSCDSKPKAGEKSVILVSHAIGR